MDINFKVGDTVERTQLHLNDKILVGDTDIITSLVYGRNGKLSGIRLNNYGSYCFTVSGFKLIKSKNITHELWI